MRHDEDLADAKEEELHEPREEVAEPRYGVLLGRVRPTVVRPEGSIPLNLNMLFKRTQQTFL